MKYKKIIDFIKTDNAFLLNNKGYNVILVTLIFFSLIMYMGNIFPKNAIYLFILCIIYAKIIFLCKIKVIGGGYGILALFISHIPGYLIQEKYNVESLTIINTNYYIRQSIFFLSLIIFSLVISILLNSIIKSKTKLCIWQSIKTINLIILLIPIVIPCCYLANWCFGSTVLGTDAILAFFQTNVEEANAYFLNFIHPGRLLLVIAFISIFIVISILLIKNTIIDITKGNLTLLTIALILCIQPALIYKENVVTEPFFKSSEILNEYKLFNEMTEHRRTLIQSIRKENIKENNGTWVIVLGESLNRMHMGCYGYKKNTTPWQSSLRSSSNTLFLAQYK